MFTIQRLKENWPIGWLAPSVKSAGIEERKRFVRWFDDEHAKKERKADDDDLS